MDNKAFSNNEDFGTVLAALLTLLRFDAPKDAEIDETELDHKFV